MRKVYQLSLVCSLLLTACGKTSFNGLNQGAKAPEATEGPKGGEQQATDLGGLDLGSGAPVNLAQGKTVVQSSTAWGGDGSRAVDGNINGNYWAGSVTHTNYENQPYLIVDLGQDMVVSSVELYNRTDCCSERLANFYISLSTSAGHPYVSAWTTQHPGALGAMRSFPTGSVSARFVGIRLNGPGILSLAEVRVMGYPHSNGKRILTDANKCVDVEGISQGTTYLHQWDCWGGANQRFDFELVYQDYYRIRAKHSGKCLSIPNGSTDRAVVMHTDCQNIYYQMFRITDKVGDKVAIKTHANKCVEVWRNHSQNGVLIYQAACDGGQNQRFRIVD